MMASVSGLDTAGLNPGVEFVELGIAIVFFELIADGTSLSLIKPFSSTRL